MLSIYVLTYGHFAYISFSNYILQLPNWTGLVEQILKPYIFLFLVDNQKDRELLQVLIDSVYGANACMNPEAPPRPDVWVTNFNAEVGIRYLIYFLA